MAKEIERKFLVNKDLIYNAVLGETSHKIKQGYLSDDKDHVVRIRINDEKAYLTIKSANIGLTRDEFEYEIPIEDGEAILSTINQVLYKERYNIFYHGYTWEVDFFKGDLEGLILAEIELSSETEEFDLPKWVSKEVSTDKDYYNSNLIKKVK